MTCGDRQSGVQNGRLHRVSTIGRLHAITSEHRHLKNTGPRDTRMILSSTGRAICVSGKAQNQNAWRSPEGVYRGLGMPLMDEELPRSVCVSSATTPLCSSDLRAIQTPSKT